MADHLSLLLLILAAFVFLVGGLVLRSESGGRWAASWSLLAVAGLCVFLSEDAPGFRLASYVFGSCFPFVVLAGALRYAGRREPRWLLGAALALGALRAALAWAERPEAAASLALMVDPSAIAGAAWLAARGARGRPAVHRLLAPGFALLAGVEAYDGYLQIRAGNVPTAPWALWILASVPLAAVQVVAGLRTTQLSSERVEQALRASTAKLRDAERAARIGHFEWRKGSRFITCSEEMIRILGLEDGPEVPVQRMSALIDPEDWVRARAIYDSTLEARGPVEVDFRILLPGGARRVLQERIQPSFSPTGELLGVSGTVRDVTEPRRAAESLRTSEERLRAILSSLVNTRVAVVGRTLELKEVYGDGPSGLRYQVPLAQAEGRSAQEFIPADDVESSRRIVEEVFATGQPRQLRRRASLPGGTFWFDVCISPLHDPSGEVREVLVVARDVTEQVEDEQERRQVEARLVQSQRLESLGVLAGGIAHDFNNLLVGVLGNAELALREVEPGSAAFGMLRDVQAASQRAAALTRQLLAYAGRTVVTPHSFELAALVAETLPLLHTGLPSGTSLRLDAPARGPWVYADDGQIGQVLLNLVTNAAEALGEKGGEVRVRTSVLVADPAFLAGCLLSDGLAPGDYACLEVSDTGCGIAPENILRIFEPFFTTRFSGRGLGLAAVLGIVRSHGGTIRVESEVGRGSRFQVLLPLSSEAAAVESEPEPASAAPVRAARLLVVDDDAMVRRTTGRMLRGRGFDVIEADSARQALDLFAAQREEIDAALLDLTMPDMDGVQLLDALRQMRHSLPIVLMSGHSPEDTLDRVAGRSRAACLPKPFGVPELLAAIGRVLEPASS